VYAPTVSYFGKEMAKADVLADKETFIERWPERLYTIDPNKFISLVHDRRQVCRHGNCCSSRTQSRATPNVSRERPVQPDFRYERLSVFGG
jgi:hypothetical protein